MEFSVKWYDAKAAIPKPRFDSGVHRFWLAAELIGRSGLASTEGIVPEQLSNSDSALVCKPSQFCSAAPAHFTAQPQARHGPIFPGIAFGPVSGNPRFPPGDTFQETGQKFSGSYSRQGETLDSCF